MISVLLAGAVRTVAQSVPAAAAPMVLREPDSRARRSFHLDAADASDSLARFSVQSGVAVVYVVDQVRGVTTHAVKGEHTARNALEQMLKNTPLAVVEDAKTGALMINRAPKPRPVPPRPAPHSRSAPEPQPSATPMTTVPQRKSPFAWLSALFALAVTQAPAQTAAPAAPGKDEVVELSPFVVTSSTDTGYQATSTLAGTRLNTPVKDLGASISIYTKDFLQDIGATNSGELLIFATGMEAAGAGGNFSGATDDINASQVFGNGPRIDPQQSSRTRGLAAPNFTRGFFPTSIAFDGYNTERVTVNRGPNAVLFGVGSPAGVVDTSLLSPDLQRNLNKIEVRYGNNGALRAAVDFNRVLLDRKLALRLAALHDREEFNQRPAFEEKKRLFGAVTYEPFKSTSLRANFETGRTRANRPLPVLPFKSISPAWDAGGRPSYDWTFYDDPARNPNAASQVAGDASTTGLLMGQEQLFDRVVVVYASPSATAPANAFNGVIASTSATAANAIKNQLFNSTANRDLAADGIWFLGTRNIAQLPGAYWTGANVLPGQLSGFAPAGIKMQGFTDFSAFDFKNRMIDESSRQGESFHAFNVALEQRAWGDRIGLELAYDTQRVDRRSKDSFFSLGNGNHIRIDTNVTLPTGQANPNLGRPYAIYGQSTWTNNLNERETMRATGYLKYDFKDLGAAWGQWLGRHTATVLYEENAVDTVSYNHRLAIDGAAARAINANIGTFQRRPAVTVYLGPSIIGNSNPLQLQSIQIPALVAGPTVAARYFSRAADATDPGAFVDAPASLVEINDGGSLQREVIKSQATVLQSYWLQDHLITLFGWRRDSDYFARRTVNYVANPADLNDPGKVHYGFNDLTFSRTPPLNVAKEIKTYGAVLRWPQKLARLPAGTDLSVFYNESANFTPLGGRVNAFGQALASPQGRTREYGFNFSALNDRVSLRVNWFETSVEGQSFTPAVYAGAVNNGVLQLASFWGVEGNVNPQLVAMRNADIELLFSTLPANFRQLYNLKFTGTAPTIATSYDVALAGAGDTTDFTAKGTEIELVYNPTRNWRILANIARQETVQSNSLPFLKDFIARMTPVWNQLRGRARNFYPLGWQPGDPVTVPTVGDFIDSNVLVPFATAIASEGSASAEQRKWRANLVTNYTFGRDSVFGPWLKGWGIGGAIRWQDKLGIGYPTSRNADASVNLDLAHPYYAPAETNVDAWVSYQRKLRHDRINWKVQLNVRNLYGDSTPIAIGVQPWGEPSTVRLAPERRWYLTNTFEF